MNLKCMSDTMNKSKFDGNISIRHRHYMTLRMRNLNRDSSL